MDGRPGSDPAQRSLAAMALGDAADEATSALYVRFVRSLALLCECAAYVDDPDYLEQIDAMLDDACRHYPLRWQHGGGRREIAAIAADAAYGDVDGSG